MNKMVLLWAVVCALLALKAFRRPSYAVGVYMLTFFAHPQFWWWGDVLEGFRWNLFAGVLLTSTVAVTSSYAKSDRGGPLATRAVPILVVMILNVLLVHVLFAVNSEASMGWLTDRLKFILLFFLLQYAIRDEKDYGIVAMAIALGMGYIGYETTINERGSFSGGRLEGVGAAGVQSSNQLASLLITGLPLATTLLFTNTTRWIKGFVILLCGLTFNVVLLCNSRGAFLGALLGAAVFLLMASGPARRHSRRLLTLGLVGTFLLLGDPEILQRFMTTFSGDTERDTSAQSRVVFWTAASRMLIDYPMGSGGNSFSEGRGWRYTSGGKSAGSAAGSPNDAGDTRAIHNGFLTEATDWGVQGFVIMMLFLWTIWRTIWRGRRLALAACDAKAIMVFGCMAASLLAWMVSSFFGDYLNDEWGFWTAALTYAYVRVHVFAPDGEIIAVGKPLPITATRGAHSISWRPAP